jgi:alkanesulfonate monooxygenase SsuD/methylene tetrahydromethanopterin reductase-like flavin-dependent oxidoreductase (luciferase family)
MRLLWRGGTASFEGKHYRLQRAAGFMQPALPPPIIVGGFGPRMAAVAGRHADGFNTQAGHPQLDQLATIAREQCAASGRDPAAFEIFAGLSERWLAPASPARDRLQRLGVQRLILLAEPPYRLP